MIMQTALSFGTAPLFMKLPPVSPPPVCPSMGLTFRRMLNPMPKAHVLAGAGAHRGEGQVIVQRRQAQRGLRGCLPRRPRQPQARLRARAQPSGAIAACRLAGCGQLCMTAVFFQRAGRSRGRTGFMSKVSLY